MLMQVEMDLNIVQVVVFVVYQYMYKTNCYCNRLMAFVHKIDLSLLLTLILLISKTGCLLNMI